MKKCIECGKKKYRVIQITKLCQCTRCGACREVTSKVKRKKKRKKKEMTKAEATRWALDHIS